MTAGTALGLLAWAGCAPSEDQLRTRAAFDLKCDEAQLDVTEIDGDTRGVRGCGAQATYVAHCEGQGYARHCTWILNGDSRPAKAEEARSEDPKPQAPKSDE